MRAVKRRLLTVLAVSVLSAGAAACGSGGASKAAPGGSKAGSRAGDKAATGGRKPASKPCTGRAGDAKVICNWTETLRTGNAKKAAGYFSVPTIVQNGTPPLRLGSRRAVVEFNRTLPCGAKLTATRRSGRFTIATFKLVKRVGASCDGVGGVASTAFLIRHDLIRAWLRVPAGGAVPQVPSNPQTPGPGQQGAPGGSGQAI
jgi:hypothetical protein